MDTSFQEEAIVCHLSDIHYGEVINLPTNQYTCDIAQERINTYFEKVLRITRDIYAKLIPIHECHVFLTGDMIHNETMRGSAKMATHTNFVDQINDCADAIANGLVKLTRGYKKLKSVTIYGVRGNHGRIGKPGENDPAANLDRLVYERLSMILDLEQHAFARYNGPTFTVLAPEAPYIVADVMGHQFIAEHWSHIMCQLGIPYYGLARIKDRRYKLSGGKMEYHLGGHFHRGFVEDDGIVTQLMCPSMCGENDYSIEMGLGAIAKQNFYTVDRKHGITSIRFIDVKG